MLNNIPHNADTSNINTPSNLSRSASSVNLSCNFPPLPPDFMDSLESLKKEWGLYHWKLRINIRSILIRLSEPPIF